MITMIRMDRRTGWTLSNGSGGGIIMLTMGMTVMKSVMITISYIENVY